MCKQMSSKKPLKNKVTFKVLAYKSYINIYIYEQELSLNNPEGLTCHKTPISQQPDKWEG